MTIRFLRGLRVTRAITEFFSSEAGGWNPSRNMLLQIGLTAHSAGRHLWSEVLAGLFCQTGTRSTPSQFRLGLR